SRSRNMRRMSAAGSVSIMSLVRVITHLLLALMHEGNEQSVYLGVDRVTWGSSAATQGTSRSPVRKFPPGTGLISGLIRDTSRRRGRYATDANARIDRARTRCEYLQRVDIKLEDLRTRVDERRHPQEHVAQRRLIDRPRAAVPAQQRRAAQLVDHVGSIEV